MGCGVDYMARRAHLLNKVEESIRAARKNNAFSPVDELAIATLKDYARLIDDARNIWEVEGDIEPLNKALAVSGAHMTKLMAALGLTPLARGELGPKSEDGGDGIDELKERRRRVLMARETPLNLAHLDNMRRITEMGGIIFPPVPALYLRPQSIDELLAHSVGRALGLFGIRIPDLPHWSGGTP